MVVLLCLAAPDKIAKTPDDESTVAEPAIEGLATAGIRITHPAEPISIAANADSHVANGPESKHRNFGSESTLLVQSGQGSDGHLAYIRFPLESVGTPRAARASLRLRALSGSAGRPMIRLHGITDDSWLEPTITWMNSPNHDTGECGYVVTDITPTARFLDEIRIDGAGDRIEIDVSDSINERFRRSRKRLTIMVLATPGASAGFLSRENTGGGAPELVIDGAAVFPAIADTHVRNGAERNATFGSETVVRVSNPGNGSGEIAYFLFDLTDHPNPADGPAVATAKLRLHTSPAVSAGGSVRFYFVANAASDSWTDSGNAPTWTSGFGSHDRGELAYAPIDTVSTGRLLGIQAPDSEPGVMEFDVTDFVNARLAAGSVTASFLVSAEPTSRGRVVFASRENSSDGPELRILPSRPAVRPKSIAESEMAADGLTFRYAPYGSMPNLVVHNQDQILTHNGHQYAAYYNAARHVCVARRALPDGRWEVAELDDYIFPNHDAHNSVAIGHSPADGTIHLSFDQLNTPLKYRKSLPEVLSHPERFAWSPRLFGPVSDQLVDGQPLVNVTYPRFFTRPDGDLMFRFRDRSPGSDGGHLFHYDGSSGKWRDMGLYSGPDGRYVGPITSAGYRIAYADRHVFDTKGRLHTSWMWREGANVGQGALHRVHGIYYAYSDDFGATWHDSAGTRQGVTGVDLLEISDAGLEIWPLTEDRIVVNDSGMDVDPAGRVHIVCQHNPDSTPSAAGQNAVRFHHYWRDLDGKWNKVPLHLTGSRARVAATENEVFLIYGNSAYSAMLVARATRAANYADWEIVHVHRGPGKKYGTDTPALDVYRFKADGTLSIMVQEQPEVPGQPTPIRVVDLHFN